MGFDYPKIPRYDYDKRHWKKIYGIEEANKLGELLTGIPADQIPQNNKPTVRVRKYTKPEYYFPPAG
jgi:hypothetical protein